MESISGGKLSARIRSVTKLRSMLDDGDPPAAGSVRRVGDTATCSSKQTRAFQMICTACFVFHARHRFVFHGVPFVCRLLPTARRTLGGGFLTKRSSRKKTRHRKRSRRSARSCEQVHGTRSFRATKNISKMMTGSGDKRKPRKVRTCLDADDGRLISGSVPFCNAKGSSQSFPIE